MKYFKHFLHVLIKIVPPFTLVFSSSQERGFGRALRIVWGGKFHTLAILRHAYTNMLIYHWLHRDKVASVAIVKAI